MSAFRRLHGAVRRHPSAFDLAVAAGLYAATLLVTALAQRRSGGHLNALAVLAAGAAYGALVWRRRWPVPALAVAVVGAMAYLTLSGGMESVVVAAPMIALYTVADAGDRRRALAIGGLAVLALALVHMVLKHGAEVVVPEIVAVVALGGLAVAAGDASRSRRAYIAEVEERARRAEHGRQQEARRQVTEERLRIARDLHDMLGHHIALIGVEAGVAAHVLDDQPEQARQALAHIRQAGRAALDELGETIGLLRQPGDPAAPTEPTLGLSSLGDLVASFTGSGLTIEHDVEGEVRAVPPAADLTAYRVIQESLTNVRKHAGGAAAAVRLSYDPAALRIVVENDGKGGPPARDGRQGGQGGGHGIAGMRERVAAVGGSMEAGPRPRGGFRVVAMLPLPETVGRAPT